MIKQQRKYHRYVWTLFLLLLPAGIIFAWLVIPNHTPVKILKTETFQPLPMVVRSASNNDYTVELRANGSKTKWQLVWKNKKVMSVPSAVLYDVTKSGGDLNKAKLVGRIESKGDYLFDLPADSAGYEGIRLLLYDFIHEQKLNSINL